MPTVNLSSIITPSNVLTASSTATLTNKTINIASNTLTGVQPTLVSGTSIKTVNSLSLLGSGNIAVGASVVLSSRTANTILGTADNSTLVDITSGTFTQTFTAAATLGSGWFVYLRNSGTGDITLDPNAAELIDGLTSYIMYPGECRLVQCSGTAFTSVVLSPFSKTFTSSGTFTKAPGYSVFCGLIWSGGSSGSKQNSPANSSGGGGGGCGNFSLPSTSFSTTTSVTIGAGGAGRTISGSDGLAGGNTSIGSLVFAFATTNSSHTGGSIVQSLLGNSGNTVGFEGSQGGNTAFVAGSVWGGAASGVNDLQKVGSSIYGGAGGGFINSTDDVTAPGLSLFGGNGGAASVASNGVNGAAPGGGGGATRSGTTSGAGARGEVRIWGNA